MKMREKNSDDWSETEGNSQNRMEKESRDEKRERLEQIKERIRIQLRDRSQVDDDVLYACIEEAVEEEARARYLPLAGRLELRKQCLERNFSMHSGNWICCRNFWKTNRSQRS